MGKKMVKGTRMERKAARARNPLQKEREIRIRRQTMNRAISLQTTVQTPPTSLLESLQRSPLRVRTRLKKKSLRVRKRRQVLPTVAARESASASPKLLRTVV